MIQGEETQAKDQQHTQQQHDHIENAEISELQSQSGFYARVREQTERFASTRLGQFVIVRADRALKLLEDTTKWSLPQGRCTVEYFRLHFISYSPLQTRTLVMLCWNVHFPGCLSCCSLCCCVWHASGYLWAPC